MSDLYRSWTPEIEVRSSGDGRTVFGIAVPYGKPQRIDSRLTEQFAHGAFAKQISAAHRVPFTRDHLSQGGSVIGKVTELRDDQAGLYFEAKISKTLAGDETLELLRDGALDQVSIGFRTGQDRKLPGGITERATATLTELAVVLNGAYGESAIASGVRSESEISRLNEAQQILAGLPVIPFIP